MNTDHLHWHYTVADRYRLIALDQLVKPATAFINWREKPAVWFSPHPIWEPTACKVLSLPDGTWRRLTREETAQHGGGLVRTGVASQTGPHDWSAYRRLSGVNPRVASALAKTAKVQGADSRRWFVSFEAVPAALWIAVEIWREGTWLPCREEGGTAIDI
jgi:hypothetical protein